MTLRAAASSRSAQRGPGSGSAARIRKRPSRRRLGDAYASRARNVDLAIRIPGAYTPVTVAPARRPRKREPSLDQWL